VKDPAEMRGPGMPEEEFKAFFESLRSGGHDQHLALANDVDQVVSRGHMNDHMMSSTR